MFLRIGKHSFVLIKRCLNISILKYSVIQKHNVQRFSVDSINKDNEDSFANFGRFNKTNKERVLKDQSSSPTRRLEEKSFDYQDSLYSTIKPKPEVTTGLQYEEEQFETICEQLKLLYFGNANSIDISKLIYLPIASVRLKKEFYFAEEISSLWWNAISPNLKNITVRDFIKFTLYGLAKINEFTQGSIVNKLGFESVLTLVEYPFRDVYHISPKNFHILLKSCNLMTIGINENDKVKISELVSRALPVFLKSYPKSKYSHSYTIEIGHIVYCLVRLEIKKPDETSLVILVNLFNSLFNSLFDKTSAKLFTTSYDYGKVLNSVAMVLLYWNVNPNDYFECFWSLWFMEVTKCYSTLHEDRGNLNRLILKNVILVTLKFNQEQEYMVDEPMWLNALCFNIVNYMMADDVKDLINQINIICAQHTDKRDGAIVKEILRVLQNTSPIK